MPCSEGGVNVVLGEYVGTTGGAVGNMGWDSGNLSDSAIVDFDFVCSL